jgi:hypothetical protein
MSTRRVSRFVTGLSGALALALASAAAGESQHAASPAGDAGETQILRERARAYWQARSERSPRVYDFYAPSRKGTPTSEGGNLRYTEFGIESADVRGDEGSVAVRVRTVGPSGQTHAGRFREAWERVDGIWYRRPVAPGLARGSGSHAARADQQTQGRKNPR